MQNTASHWASLMWTRQQRIIYSTAFLPAAPIYLLKYVTPLQPQDIWLFFIFTRKGISPDNFSKHFTINLTWCLLYAFAFKFKPTKRAAQFFSTAVMSSLPTTTDCWLSFCKVVVLIRLSKSQQSLCNPVNNSFLLYFSNTSHHIMRLEILCTFGKEWNKSLVA